MITKAKLRVLTDFPRLYHAADALAMSESCLSRILNGRRKPTESERAALIERFGPGILDELQAPVSLDK